MTTTHTRWPRLLVMALALFLSGCAVLEPEPFSRDRRALAEARARWQAQGPDSYRYVYTPECNCPPTAARATWVTVEDGAVVYAEYVEVDEPVNTGPQTYSTVDQLFALVEFAYDEHAAEVRVRYDPVLGYPQQVWIDWARSTADEETGFAASSLSALPAATVRTAR